MMIAKFSNSEGSQKLFSADENGSAVIYKVKGMLLEEEKSMISIVGRVYDLCWYPSDKGLAVVGSSQGKTNGRVFAISGTDQGSIPGTKRLTTVDMFFEDEKNIKTGRVVTGGDDLKLRFYEYSGGFRIKDTKASKIKFKANINMVRFSPDGKFLIAVGGKEMFILNSADDYKTVVQRKGNKKEGDHMGNIYAVCWNPEGNAFLTASADKSVKLWSFDGSSLKLQATKSFTGEAQFGISQNDFQVGCCYIGDGATDQWATLSLSGDINLLTSKGTELVVDSTVVAQTYEITAMDVDKSTGSVVVSTAKGEVVLYDKSGQGKRIKGIKDAKKAVGVVLLDDMVLSTGWDNSVRNMTTESMKVTTRNLTLGGQPVNFARATNSKEFVVAATSAEVTIISKSKPNAAAAKLAGGNADIKACALNNDGTKLLVGYSNKVVKLYDVKGSSITETGVATEELLFPIFSLAFSADGQYFAVGTKKYAYLCNMKGEILADSWTKHSQNVRGVDFSPDGKWLLTIGSEGDIGIWDLAKPKGFKPKKFFSKAHPAGGTQAKWLDSKTFYSAGSYDGTIKRWEVSL